MPNATSLSAEFTKMRRFGFNQGSTFRSRIYRDHRVPQRPGSLLTQSSPKELRVEFARSR